MNPDPQFMIDLVNARMPFGRYEGSYITDLPVHYLEWFEREGFPAGKLGQQIGTMFEIKSNGIDAVLKPIIREHRRR